jgi:hypothetical protein
MTLAARAKNIEHLNVAGLDHQVERAREQEVADEHAGRIAPNDVRGFLAAPHRGDIDHVVVQQRGAMDELDRRRQLARAVAAAAQQARRRQGDERADAFAAGVDQVRGQVRDHADRAGQILVDDASTAARSSAKSAASRSTAWGAPGFVLAGPTAGPKGALRLTFSL